MCLIRKKYVSHLSKYKDKKDCIRTEYGPMVNLGALWICSLERQLRIMSEI